MMSDPLVWVRAVHFAATALAAGTVSCLALVAEPACRAASAPKEWHALLQTGRRLVWGALIVAIGSGGIWLLIVAAGIYGVSLADVALNGGAWTVLAQTRFGSVCEVRLGLTILLAALIVWPATRVAQLLAAAALIGSLAMIGHAGATPGLRGDAFFCSDIVHLLAAGAWIGGLPLFALLLRRTRHAHSYSVRTIARTAALRFSPLGIICVAALLASGIFDSLNVLASPRDLIASDYGRLVLVKIAIFIVLLAIAAINRLRLTPRLPASRAARALERNSLAEIALALVVFLAVGALGTLAPPVHDHVHVPARPIPADATFVHIHSTGAMADVTIEPGHTGPARASIFLMRDDFSVLPAKHVTVALAPQTPSSAAPVAHRATRDADGTWRANDLSFGAAGIWTVTITIDAGTGQPIVLDAPIMIDR